MFRVGSQVFGIISTLLLLSGVASADPAPVNLGVGKKAPPLRDVAPSTIPGVPMPNPSELVYAPIPPCRAFFPAQQAAASSISRFQITGNSDLSAQGGPATGCGVPESATAVAVSLTAKSSLEGYLKAYADGAAQPPIRSLSHRPNVYETTGAVVALGANGRMAVFSQRAAYLIGDVTGYFAPQIQVYMNSNGTAYSATTRIVSTTKLGTGFYSIEVDRNLQLCSVHANIAGGFYYASAYPSGNTIYVQTWSISSGTATPTDLYHNVSVKC